MCSLPTDDITVIHEEECYPSDRHTLSGERKGMIHQHVKKSNSMPISRVRKAVGPDDDWVSMGRSMNLLSAKHANLSAVPPPSKFQRSSSQASTTLGRTKSFPRNSKQTSSSTLPRNDGQVLYSPSFQANREKSF